MKKIAITSILLILFIFAFSGTLNADHTEIHCKHFAYGIPLGTSASNDLIIRDIYVLSSNDHTKFADWVAYRLDPATVVGDAQTKRKWKADPYLAEPETLEPSDYDGAHAALKTDRGHQAPLASFKGTPYWYQTNYLSNITPQKSDLNQGPWKVLEEKVRVIVKAGNTVWVMTGPLYEKAMPTMPGSDEPHFVPSGYWKIVVFPKDNIIHTAAFIFDQDTSRSAKVIDHIVSIDEVELMSGLNFLWQLPDNREGQIESRIGSEWAGINFQ
jgi:endonuclease G